MAAFHPRFEDLPDTFAVFPLPGVLLLPHAKLPLNIFEPRYLAMTEDALANGRMFAMIQPDPQSRDGPTGPGLYRIGCLGRLSSFSETDDGRLLIQLTGLARFVIEEELEMRRGYRRVRGNFAAFRADLNPPPDPGEAVRAALLEALRGYFARAGIDANWDTIRRMPPAQLPLSLAMACPFAPAEKQALMETSSLTDLPATLLALLRMGATEGTGGGRVVS